MQCARESQKERERNREREREREREGKYERKLIRKSRTKNFLLIPNMCHVTVRDQEMRRDSLKQNISIYSPKTGNQETRCCDIYSACLCSTSQWPADNYTMGIRSSSKYARTGYMSTTVERQKGLTPSRLYLQLDPFASKLTILYAGVVAGIESYTPAWCNTGKHTAL